jgi:predicted DsbA family dithiol-disulfide isomerase
MFRWNISHPSSWLKISQSRNQYETLLVICSTVGLEQEDFQTVLRAAEQTETTQENIQDWLQLDEGDPGFQLLQRKKLLQ